MDTLPETSRSYKYSHPASPVKYLNLCFNLMIVVQEFMRGGEALHDLICDVLEHAEMEALLEEVQNSSRTK